MKGAPGKVVRMLTDREIEGLRLSAAATWKTSNVFSATYAGRIDVGAVLEDRLIW